MMQQQNKKKRLTVIQRVRKCEGGRGGRGEREAGREKDREVPAAVTEQAEVFLVGKERSGEMVAAALPPLTSIPLWFLLNHKALTTAHYDNLHNLKLLNRVKLICKLL